MSRSNEWTTPQDFFDALDREFHFTLDAAATKENAKCAKYFTAEDNGLAQSWAEPLIVLKVRKNRGIIEVCRCGCHTGALNNAQNVEQFTRGLRLTLIGAQADLSDSLHIVKNATISGSEKPTDANPNNQDSNLCLPYQATRPVRGAVSNILQRRSISTGTPKCIADLLLGVENAIEKLRGSECEPGEPTQPSGCGCVLKNNDTHDRLKVEKQNDDNQSYRITSDESANLAFRGSGRLPIGKSANNTGTTNAPTAEPQKNLHRITSSLWQIQTALAQCERTSYLRVTDVIHPNNTEILMSGARHRVAWQPFETTLIHCPDCFTCIPVQPHSAVWVNPPYGREIGTWVKKAYLESRKPNTTVVMLIPARTDTKAWHRYIFGTAEVRFVAGRLRFGGGQKLDNAPFPCAVVIFSGSVSKCSCHFQIG